MTFEITPPIDKRTAGPLTGRAFPEMAEALRSLAEPVLSDWEKYLRQTISPAMALSFNQLRDGLPDILAKMADALASGEPAEVARLVARSPAQGIHRFQVHYDVRDVSTEDRVLRRLLLERVDVALGRRATREEAVALNWALDLMNEQAMVAFVEHQNARLRQAAEAELKYLSFLCHDLRGNLNGVTLWLQVLRTSLAGSPQFADEVGSLDEAQRAILGTMGGMGRILQADRLRYASDDVRPETFDLHAVAASVARSSALQAKQAGVQLTVEVPADATVSSDGELVTLVLQNLIGNAIKYSPGGTVHVRAGRVDNAAWSVAVTDNGPGIAADRLDRIFEAFRRGEMHGQAGIGLGLAIASRAAKLLNAKLTVNSTLGVGSTFILTFPSPAVLAGPQAIRN